MKPLREILVDPTRLSGLSVPGWYAAATAPSESESDDLTPEDRKAQYAELQHLLNKLPPLEADFVDLYYGLGKEQGDIAEIFGCTQFAVSYRISRAIQRLQFLRRQPTVDERKLRRALAKVPVDEFNVDLICDFLKTASWSTTARHFGLPGHAGVRSRVLARMEHIEAFLEGTHTSFVRRTLLDALVALRFTIQNIGILSDDRVNLK